MIPKFIAAPVATGLLTMLGPCDPPPPQHVVCVEDPDGWTRCRGDQTGLVTVAFPTHGLICPTEDSCAATYQRDGDHAGWVITPVVP